MPIHKSLVSGANRGIGFGLTEALAKRPGTVVFAGARDPTNATALNALAVKYPHSVHVVKLTSGSTEDNKSAVAEIEKTVINLLLEKLDPLTFTLLGWPT